MNKTWRIGLIGCGKWGKFILRDLNSLGCEVWVVATSDESEKNAAAGNAAGFFKDLSQLPQVDGAIVATPTATHADVIEALLDRGIPIFTEKPLSNDLERARKLHRTASDRIFVMHKWRYHPGIEALAAIVRKEELGPPVGLQTYRLGCGNPHADVDSTWILLPHDLTIGLEILGELPAPRAAAADVTDGFAHGLTGVLGTSPWQTVEVSTRFPGVRREVILRCRDGVARLKDSYDDHLEITRFPDRHSMDVPEPELRPISTEFPLLRELRTFVGYLEGGAAPRSTTSEALQVVDSIAQLRHLSGLTDG